MWVVLTVLCETGVLGAGRQRAGACLAGAKSTVGLFHPTVRLTASRFAQHLVCFGILLGKDSVACFFLCGCSGKAV